MTMRYLRRATNGDLLESVDDRIWAVALEIARAEEKWNSTEKAVEYAHAFAKPETLNGNLCPECGGASAKQEGCEKCISGCGWSTC